MEMNDAAANKVGVEPASEIPKTGFVSRLASPAFHNPIRVTQT